MYKKKLSILALAVIMFILAGCQSNGSQDASTLPEVTMPSITSGNSTQIEADASEAENTQPEGTKRTLVAYFSCTGNTEKIAEWIAAETGADLYSITPEAPYTTDDLNYSDSASRATREQNDESARPAISGVVEDMEQYDTIYLGYPIWWGQAPKIISTFIESYDFTGKTVVPFCTSGSSGVGTSDTDLHGLAAESTVWMNGERFSPNASESSVVQWLDGLGIYERVAGG